MFKKIIEILMLVFAIILTQKAWSANSLSSVQPANAQNLSVYLDQIVHPNQYRHYQNIQELNRVSSWIKSQMEKFGIPCEYQNYSVSKQSQAIYRNVVCKLSVGAANSIIVGAHYDVHGQSNGADDNASGVAGVLETARILASEKNSLNQNIEFVFYTLEEPPYFRTEHMGSAVHVKSILSSKNQITGVFILEMIGYFSQQNIQDYPAGLKWWYPAHGNFIGAVSNVDSSGLGKSYCHAMKQLDQLQCERLIAPSFITGVDFSDHLNYWNAGIPALMITDTAFFRNKNYHTPKDKIATLNLDKMKDVVNGVVLTILKSGKL